MMDAEQVGYILLPGEKLDVNRFAHDQKLKSSTSDFEIQSQDTLVTKHSGWLWQEGAKVAIFNTPFQYRCEKDDFVIAIIQSKSSDNYFCDIGAGGNYVLNGMDFEGATKKNRPLLQVGRAVYCRVEEPAKYLRGKLSCINPKSKKEWVEYQISIVDYRRIPFWRIEGGSGDRRVVSFYRAITGFTEKALAPEESKQILQNITIKKTLKQISIGKNGKIWLTSENSQNLLLLINILQKLQHEREAEWLGFITRYQHLFK